MTENNSSLNQTPFYNRRGVLVTPQAHSVIKPRRGAWVVAKAQDSIMLLWPDDDKDIPDLIGGGVDDGESLEQAAQREWVEETGLSFEPESGPHNTYHHVRGFCPDDQSEFWIYDQTFSLYTFERKQELGKKWRNPEGDLAGWVRFEEVASARINRAHWLAIEVLMPEINIVGKN